MNRPAVWAAGQGFSLFPPAAWTTPAKKSEETKMATGSRVPEPFPYDRHLVPLRRLLSVMADLNIDSMTELMGYLARHHRLAGCDLGWDWDAVADLLECDCQRRQAAPAPTETAPDAREPLSPGTDHKDKEILALAALATIGPNVSQIARVVGVPRSTLYSWPTFRKALESMKASGEKAKRNRRRGRPVGDRDYGEDE